MLTLTHDGDAQTCRHEGFPEIELDLKTSFRRNMAKSLRGFVKRPAATRHSFTLRFLDAPSRDSFADWLKEASGEKIDYTFEDVTKRCRIINYGTFTHQGKNSFTLDMELEEVI